jgi:transcriptional regulator with XRE-family HTH domain
MVTYEKRKEIERLLAEGELSQNEIARRLGCSRCAVQNAAKGKPSKSPEPLYKQIRSLPIDAPRDFLSRPAPEPDVWGRYISDKLPDTILVIPDLQAPYNHPDALSFLSMVAQRYKPDQVVGIGDEVDFSFLSNHDKYPEVDNPVPELEAALNFMERLFKLFPSALALTSNHVHGRLATARKNGRIPPTMLRNWREIISAPRGWEWYEEVRLGNYLFRHGDGWAKLTGMHLVRAVPDQYGKHFNVVHGHIHSEAGIKAVERVGDEDLFAAYTGCLINPRCKAFDYTKAPKNKLGCLVIIHGIPKRVPMRLDAMGRWCGTL